jgi:hypothetical protein
LSHGCRNWSEPDKTNPHFARRVGQLAGSLNREDTIGRVTGKPETKRSMPIMSACYPAIIFLAVASWVLGSRMESGLQAALDPGGCNDDSHSVQAAYFDAGFADWIDICWFRRIVSTRR